MSLISFNPFNVSLDELQPNHLDILHGIAEGWYVEYKGQVVPPKNIAKSISAFANHYGGWLFYGIEAASSGNNLATGFPGIDNQEVPRLLEMIRNAVTGSIQPPPYYDYKVLEGPCVDIGLPDGRSVVVVEVPSGPNPPYIHADGRIYRRIADASDPKYETDRFVLDNLWQRGNQSRTKLASFLVTEPDLSEAEQAVSHIELFLLTDPLGAMQQETALTFDGFVEVMTDSTRQGVALPFDNFYTMADGFVARQVSSNDPYGLVLTWRHYADGASIVSIPLSSAYLGNLNLDGWLEGYQYGQEVVELLQQNRHEASHLLDLTPLFTALVGVMAKQQRLKSLGHVRGGLYGKAAIYNIWRRIPFLDVDPYVRFVKQYGFPVIQFDKEFAPLRTTYESLVEFERAEHLDDIEVQFLSAATIFPYILNALGLPSRAFVSDEGFEDDIFQYLQNVCARVQEVNRRRALATQGDTK